MKFKVKCLYVCSVLVLMVIINPKAVYGQFAIQHRPPTVVERNSDVTLSFTVPGINPGEVRDAFLFYKMNGDIAFRQKRAVLNQSEFTVTINTGSDLNTSLEYYFEIEFVNGEDRTYPENLSGNGPVRVEVVDKRPAAETGTADHTNIEYTILSPGPGEGVTPKDAVVAITLFYDEGAVDTTKSSFHLFLDGKDVTGKARASNYFFSYVPDRLSPGKHAASLKLKTGSAFKDIASWTFSVIETGAVISARTAPGVEPAGAFMPSGQVELTARNQVIAGSTNNAYEGNMRISGQKGSVRYSAYGLLTSQEDPRLQPQNRYGAELYIGNWFELQAGHIYPTLSPLTIAGRRVQGINTGLHALNDAINLQFLYGKLNRSISNLYNTSVEARPQIFNGQIVDTTYSLGFREGGLGTFQRDILGGRLSFGRGETFQLGLNMLKVQDDTTSINVIENYTDILNYNPGLAGSLSSKDRQKLQNEPGLLSVNGNPRPKGNFVAASDVLVNLNKNRIQFRADGALSLLNEDIGPGPLTRERADELGFTIGSRAENLFDRLSWLIIINENMNALPLRFTSQGGSTGTEAFFPTSILAGHSELSMNYFDNNLRVQYRWVGPDFNSLANSTIRKDIAGFTLSDRFRLLQDQIYVTLGYEALRDNVVNNKDATTNTNTIRSNVSWYPVKRILPRISIGLMTRSRKNGVVLNNPFVPASLVYAAVQNYQPQSDSLVVGPQARFTRTTQFTASVSQQFNLFNITNDASINYSILNTDDRYFAYGDAVSTSLSFNLTNRFNTLPLSTTVGFNINDTETGSGQTDIYILGFNVGGSVYLLDQKLNISAGVAITKNTSDVRPLAINDNGTPNDSSDDYYEPDPAGQSRADNNSFIFNSSARYAINRHHAFVVDMRFTDVNSTLSSINIPNDHILQARYIFSF